MPVSVPPIDQGIAAHGVILSVNLDENGDVTTEFTEIGGINSDIPQPRSRTWTETTPHDKDADEGVTGVLRRGEWTFTLNYRQQNPIHLAMSLALNKNTYFGMQFQGIEGRIAGDGTDVVLVSGQLISFNEGNPVRDGARSAAVSFRPSGNFYMDGVLYGPRDF